MEFLVSKLIWWLLASFVLRPDRSLAVLQPGGEQRVLKGPAV